MEAASAQQTVTNADFQTDIKLSSCQFPFVLLSSRAGRGETAPSCQYCSKIQFPAEKIHQLCVCEG